MSDIKSLEDKLKKAHVRLMKARETAPYIGALMLGKSDVIEEWPKKFGPNPQDRVTACTDGVNKMYGADFIKDMSMPELCGLVLHENLHVFLKQIHRHMDLARNPDDRMLLNVAMDFVVNDIIFQIQDKQLAVLPDKEKYGGVHDVKFRNWSVREVFNFLKTGKNNQGKQEGKPKKGSGKGNKIKLKIGDGEYELDGMDEHDTSGLDEATPEQVREAMAQINNAIHQGGLLAGRFGLELPKAIKEAAQPEVDWREETREFVVTHTRGKDEYTWRKFNKRRLADDYYLPSTESEKIEGVIIANDTSGSIGPDQMGEWLEHISLVCTQAQPEWVKLLWWDTEVSGEQLFSETEYSNIKSLAKPTGGGGTHVGCVAKYIQKKGLTADCIIVLTDGYTESDITWPITIPTLWVVTQNTSFNPPTGRIIHMRG